MRRGNRTTGRQPITRSQSTPNLITPTGKLPPNQPPQPNQPQPNQQQQQQQYNQQQQIQPNQPQMQQQPGGKQSFAQKLIASAPQYLIKRIFANINTIHDLVMGGGWHEPQFKMLLKHEIQELTKNLKDPSLQVTIDELTEAANVPLTLFINKITEIIQKHINDIVYKLTSMAGNLVGEIPGVNVVANSILAASNAVHVARNFTDLGGELFQNIQDFKNDMTAVMEKFNPSMNQQFAPQFGQMVQPFSQPFNQQMMQPYPQQSQYGQPFGQPIMPLQYAYGGGSNAHGPHNMKDAKKHLHHLHRKKNRTLRRIHHSLHEFLTSNRNKRSIKAKAKH